MSCMFLTDTRDCSHNTSQAEAAAAGSASADGGDGESPEELAKWTAELGAKGDAAATKMQARQRAKQVS